MRHHAVTPLSFVAATFILGACSRSSATPAPSEAPASKDAAGAAASGSAAPTEIVFTTSRGSFTVRLDAAHAPISTANMIAYVKEGFYDGTIFHRVIPDFMIQGGGFTPDLSQKPTHAPIKNEAENGLSNRRGTVAMARTNVVDSATAQFFVNTKDNTQLDHGAANFGYAVIGEVVAGMDVIDAIRNVPTRCPSWTGEPCPATETLPPGMRDVPKEPVLITKATIKP